eukprot:TRINITY_DN1625_c0_g1_i1.p1 TRINITY_DN1625_c0_g1~~TRINITY_DN1625_c0_g1_i1.p1  ORF type:complete len:340 (+),score=93.96 TRINITY_DN1625_c0_g1_i1:38-1057(+)
MEQTTTAKDVPLLDRYKAERIVGEDVDDLSYMRVSVNDFGMQMLKQMGWYEGRGVGKNPTNALMTPIQYVPRHQRTGLGAIPKHIAQKELGLVDSKGKQKHGDLVAATKDGKVRHYVEIGEKLVANRSRGHAEVGELLVILSGRHEGMVGRLIEKDPKKKECVVQLTKGEANVRVPLSDVVRYDEYEANTRDEDTPGLANSSKQIKKEKENGKEDKKKKKKLKWVTENIRVRIISDKVNDGKYYNLKVVVTDVLDKRTFLALTPSGDVVEDLREKEIETVMPKEGELVKVLVGEHRGEIAKLLKKDKDKNKCQVQLVENLAEILSLSLDDCAEYVPHRK